MRFHRFWVVAFLLLLLPGLLLAQGKKPKHPPGKNKPGFFDDDDPFSPNPAASFLEMRVVQGAQLDFRVNGMQTYEQGIANTQRLNATFEVRASDNFQVQLSHSDFVNEWGQQLNARNFGLRIEDAGDHKINVHHHLLNGHRSPSRLVVLDGPLYLVTPKRRGNSGKGGNAGEGRDNRFYLHFEFATPAVLQAARLPSLLQQQVNPGTYRGDINLVVVPEF